MDKYEEMRAEFWQKAYLAAYALVQTHELACKAANAAVENWEKANPKPPRRDPASGTIDE